MCTSMCRFLGGCSAQVSRRAEWHVSLPTLNRRRAIRSRQPFSDSNPPLSGCLLYASCAWLGARYESVCHLCQRKVIVMRTIVSRMFFAGLALVATASGLCIAIVAAASYYYLLGKVDRIVQEMDILCNEVIDNIAAPRPVEKVTTRPRVVPPREQASG